jgi:hypothetical protein
VRRRWPFDYDTAPIFSLDDVTSANGLHVLLVHRYNQFRVPYQGTASNNETRRIKAANVFIVL